MDSDLQSDKQLRSIRNHISNDVNPFLFAPESYDKRDDQYKIEQLLEAQEAGGSHQDGEAGVQVEEGVVELMRSPAFPTRQEYEEHNKTHIPFKPWCRLCVENKARNNPH